MRIDNPDERSFYEIECAKQQCKDTNIYATAYELCLPDKALLQAKVKEWIQEFEESKED